MLEVGAGEGVLTERLAAVAAHLHTVEIDRGLEPALAPLAALPNVSLHWGDAMKVDLAALEPAPTAMVANLPYSVATPLILRTIEQLPSLARWTVMVQREIADRLRAAPGSRTYGSPERASPSSPARSSWSRKVDPAVFRPRPRVDSAILRPAPHRARRRPGDPRARPRRLRPPPQVARPLARARRGRARWRRPGRRSPSSACPRTRGPRRSRRASSPPCPRSCRPTPDSSRTMLLHAPAKLNLCLYLGPRRDDGLHELCSLFEPLALADLIEVSEAERDEVICPGVEGENLAARALAALRERGWERPPLRVEIEKRVPVAAGLGGGSADAAAVLRLAAGEVDELQGAGGRARRRRALAAAPGAGPGPRRRRAGRAAARAGPARGASCCPTAAASAPPRSSPRPTGSGSAASRRSWRRSPRALREAAGAGASPLAYPELLVNDLEPAGALAAPRDRRRARRAARSRRRGRAAQRLRPDRGRALRRPRRRPRRRRRDRPRRRDRLRGGEGAVRMPGEGARRRQPQTPADRDRRRDRRRSATTSSASELGSLDLQGLLEDVSNTLGAWTYLLVGVFAFAETGAFVGLVVPGETVMLLGGAVAGQGAIDIYLLIAIAWFAAWLGDTTSFFIGRRLGRELRDQARPPGRDQPRALRAGRGLLLPPRRQDDLHRPLHQPRPRPRPVHRRQLGDALPRLRPLQRPRHRALGQRPHPRSATSSRAASRPPPSTPAKAPSCWHADRRRRRHRSSSTASSGSRRTGAGRCLDGGPRGDPLAGRARPPLPAAAARSSGTG